MRPTVIVVTEKQLFPIDEGNRARIVTMIQALRDCGFRVALVVRRPVGARATLRTWWLADNVTFVDGERFSPGSPLAYDSTPFFDPLKAAVRRFAPIAVIAEYIWMAPCLDVVEPGILRVVDTLDLMHVRQNFRDVLSHIWVDCTEDEERRLLEKADAVLAIQSREMERFRALVPSRRVIYLPHCVSLEPARRIGCGPIVAIIASDNPGNVEGFSAFIADGWPRVRRRVPRAELRIFGPLASKAPGGDGIVRIGYSRDLTAAYRNAAVIINPVRFGTGLKIKTVEALGRGKAVVTTACGAEGLESGAGKAFVVVDDMEKFGDAICALLEDEARRRQFESSASEFAAAELSREKAYGPLVELLNSRLHTDRRVASLAESRG